MVSEAQLPVFSLQRGPFALSYGLSSGGGFQVRCIHLDRGGTSNQIERKNESQAVLLSNHEPCEPCERRCPSGTLARVVADTGRNVVQTGVPDVMVGLPNGTVDSSTGPQPPVPGDSGGSGGGTGQVYPGFLGEYLVRNGGSWWAVEGDESNALLQSGGACTADTATFDWAEFACETARFQFEFSMRVEAPRIDPLVGRVPHGALRPHGDEASHTLALAASQVDGVRLTVVAWTAPPEPLPAGGSAGR